MILRTAAAAFIVLLSASAGWTVDCGFQQINLTQEVSSVFTDRIDDMLAVAKGPLFAGLIMIALVSLYIDYYAGRMNWKDTAVRIAIVWWMLNNYAGDGNFRDVIATAANEAAASIRFEGTGGETAVEAVLDTIYRMFKQLEGGNDAGSSILNWVGNILGVGNIGDAGHVLALIFSPAGWIVIIFVLVNLIVGILSYALDVGAAILLLLLYLVGPLAIAFGTLRSTQRIAWSWFEKIIEFNLWKIVYAAFMVAIATVYEKLWEIISNAGPVDNAGEALQAMSCSYAALFLAVVVGIVSILMLSSIPKIADSLVDGRSASMGSGAAVAVGFIAGKAGRAGRSLLSSARANLPGGNGPDDSSGGSGGPPPPSGRPPSSSPPSNSGHGFRRYNLRRQQNYTPRATSHDAAAGNSSTQNSSTSTNTSNVSSSSTQASQTQGVSPQNGLSSISGASTANSKLPLSSNQSSTDSKEDFQRYRPAKADTPPTNHLPDFAASALNLTRTQPNDSIYNVDNEATPTTQDKSLNPAEAELQGSDSQPTDSSTQFSLMEESESASELESPISERLESRSYGAPGPNTAEDNDSSKSFARNLRNSHIHNERIKDTEVNSDGSLKTRPLPNRSSHKRPVSDEVSEPSATNAGTVQHKSVSLTSINTSNKTQLASQSRSPNVNSKTRNDSSTDDSEDQNDHLQDTTSMSGNARASRLIRTHNHNQKENSSNNENSHKHRLWQRHSMRKHLDPDG